jgi:hypothetical protein
MQPPTPRGPLTQAVIAALTGAAPLDVAAATADVRRTTAVGNADALTDDDLQLALWTCYELHYRGFAGVDPDWEWDPGLLTVRRELEAVFEADLRRRTTDWVDAALDESGDLAERLFTLTGSFEGPAVASYVQREAGLAQFREFMVHRSLFHLKESDPQSWAIPRLEGGPKATLVELQYDEYGGGRADRVHQTLFGDSLESCGLDRGYGAYVDHVPGSTLAVSNTMSLLGLHRRLAPAAMGHFGAFEASSSLPCRKYVGGIRRLKLPDTVATYFEEHVEADAVHEQLALRGICAALVEQDPSCEREVLFGAATCLFVDAVSGEQMLTAWQQGRSSLSIPLAKEVVA